MPDLLQIGCITKPMKTRLEAAFTIPQLVDFDPEPITYIVTNGHDGVPADLMVSLPNQVLLPHAGSAMVQTRAAMGASVG